MQESIDNSNKKARILGILEFLNDLNEERNIYYIYGAIVRKRSDVFSMKVFDDFDLLTQQIDKFKSENKENRLFFESLKRKKCISVLLLDLLKGVNNSIVIIRGVNVQIFRLKIVII
ncbi:hypothetical protein CWI38_0108p0050 [Hamiltosporidium tvaerminnensis]|uniref:Uncharacterized protein n=1 Tax=Hamiltosporidium tvaerminnensis TaxID=1176355 RepID=A0A4V2JXV6_9MICR|nr:hypothetical protein CWI38_0473p0010 [Hamiltosporidium tvaerminnensis]TBU20234.1 hypothetical protein CWI38_0108p0050 [Hamiltosporidium tvaerminnensis]